MLYNFPLLHVTEKPVFAYYQYYTYIVSTGFDHIIYNVYLNLLHLCLKMYYQNIKLQLKYILNNKINKFYIVKTLIF